VLVYCAGEKGNVSEAVASINQRTVRRMAQNMVKQVNACIYENGGHFQHVFLNWISGFLYCITK
jgi:hypothetical protein